MDWKLQCLKVLFSLWSISAISPEGGRVLLLARFRARQVPRAGSLEGYQGVVDLPQRLRFLMHFLTVFTLRSVGLFRLQEIQSKENRKRGSETIE